MSEQKFYDYKTAPVTGTQVVDLHRTGMSFYDDFLNGDTTTLNYLKNEKNLVGQVEIMSPAKYFQACSDYGFINTHPSVTELVRQRRQDLTTLQHLKDVLLVYKRRFPMPVLNKAESAQEGLHRMLVIADLYGWDHEVPVLVVDWADKQRAFEEQKRKRIERIEYNIKRAVQNALMYKFRNIEELREQLQWELDKQFDYNDDGINTPVKFELADDDKGHSFIVSIGTASYSFDYDDVKFIDDAEEDEFDIDDLDSETSEDFLKRYFGDNWRETHPHLKQTFKID